MSPPMSQARRGISYSEAIAEAYASAPESSIVLDTLEFLHPSFMDDEGNPTSIRVVSDNAILVARLEADAPMNAGEMVTFQKVFFKFTRPAEASSGATQETSIQVDNAAHVMTPYLDQAKESRAPIRVLWRPYLLSDLSGPHILPVVPLTLSDVRASMTGVTARAGYRDLSNRRFPASEYTAKKFPGLTVR